MWRNARAASHPGFIWAAAVGQQLSSHSGEYITWRGWRQKCHGFGSELESDAWTQLRIGFTHPAVLSHKKLTLQLRYKQCPRVGAIPPKSPMFTLYVLMCGRVDENFGFDVVQLQWAMVADVFGSSVSSDMSPLRCHLPVRVDCIPPFYSSLMLLFPSNKKK